MNRPTLIPGLPRVWRGPTELQLGSGPTRAVLLELPDARVAGVLDLLDGTRSERLVMLEAAERGIPPDVARTLLETLHAAGLAVPAASLIPAGLPEPARDRLLSEAAALAIAHPASPPARTLRRRAASRVVVSGCGRLGAGIAVALAEAGVGHVQPDLPGLVVPGELPGSPLRPSDVGRPRREAVLAAIAPGPENDRRDTEGVRHGVDDARIGAASARHNADDTRRSATSTRRSAASTRRSAEGARRGAATLVVQLDHDQPVELIAAAHAQRRQPHLAVSIREGAAVIGPLVPAAGAPCLACLELHRRDRDAGWPGPPRPDPPEPCAVATLLAATAFATAEVLTFLDGGTPSTLGVSAEIAAPGRVRRRTWPPHPSCDCARRPRPSPRDPNGTAPP